ncbi:hypothetical protein O6H91_06G135300 [Diphasiastrum complanatum]|uniref:Uncharacterized protein n=1 Tax=Diphasiastrum complanatum TaxID=34168 RepID=A0ACC2DJ60_DIPCM|nr:hypothetical protein O6H91_06G135300 [Diphasiastrum complanatum]
MPRVVALDCEKKAGRGVMEILNAVEGCSDKRLRTKCKQALYVIDRTLALYKFEEVAFSFNGGKDSTVLLHLLRAACVAGEAKRTIHIGAEESTCLELGKSIRTIYFESPSAFPEIDSFTYETARVYNLEMEILRQDFKSGLSALFKTKPIKAVFLGTRIGDPNAVGQEQFAPSSAGWPPFMRVNPILNWSYRDVWEFLLVCKVPYCKLYDQGYTSIGSVHDTLPNEALSVESHFEQDKSAHNDTASGVAPLKETYRPAYLLRDGRLERAGRLKREKNCKNEVSSNGVLDLHARTEPLFSASVLVVGDEILRGEVEDQSGVLLSKELRAIGWSIRHRAILANDIDSISEEVEQRSNNSDIAPDEEFEEFLRDQVGGHCPGDQNQMAKLPEGITELLHHQELLFPVIKCHNVFILPGPTIKEVELQWKCLLEWSKTSNVFGVHQPFTLIKLRTSVPEVEIAGPLAKLSLDFPDLSIGCYRESAQALEDPLSTKTGKLIISILGKNPTRVKAAVCALNFDVAEGVFCVEEG